MRQPGGTSATGWRLHWLHGVIETVDGLPTRRTVYPVLLEHRAGDGEWEPVARDTLAIMEPDAWAREDTWAAVEDRLLERAGLTRRQVEGYAAPSPGPDGTPWAPGRGRGRTVRHAGDA